MTAMLDEARAEIERLRNDRDNLLAAHKGLVEQLARLRSAAPSADAADVSAELRHEVIESISRALSRERAEFNAAYDYSARSTTHSEEFIDRAVEHSWRNFVGSATVAYDAIKDILTRARREGAEAMREAAAQIYIERANKLRSEAPTAIKANHRLQLLLAANSADKEADEITTPPLPGDEPKEKK